MPSYTAARIGGFNVYRRSCRKHFGGFAVSMLFFSSVENGQPWSNLNGLLERRHFCQQAKQRDI